MSNILPIPSPNANSDVPTPVGFEERCAALRAGLRVMRRVAVAFSGGVDSALVLRVALDELGRDNVLAVTGRSASLKRSELEAAEALARSFGAEHVVLDTSEFDNAAYLANPANRCYFCKTTLYEHVRPLLASRGLTTLINGTNADDLTDYRPGLAAADEHGVRSPLAEAGMTKRDVRELARRLSLDVHDKPASPCLSSRVPYGESITPEKLRRIEDAEDYLASLGFREVRVRSHADLARIEVPAADLPRLADPQIGACVAARLKSLGFAYVTLDLAGFRSGSLNDVIRLNLPERSGSL